MAKYVKVETIAPEMNVIAIPNKIYDSADTDRMFPSFTMIATTANEKRNAPATIVISGIIESPRTIENAAPRAAHGAKMRSNGAKCFQNPFEAPFHALSFVGPLWALCGPYCAAKAGCLAL